jgi:hypothetical protein
MVAKGRNRCRNNIRFSFEEIQQIRDAEGTHEEIAMRFGCSRQYVGEVKRGLYRVAA